MDPGIGLASLGAPLQLDVSRDGYTMPVTLTQVSAGAAGKTASTPKMDSPRQNHMSPNVAGE
jgi:hypothetical protein